MLSLDMIRDELAGDIYRRPAHGEHLIAAVSYILQCAPQDHPEYAVLKPFIQKMAKDAWPWDTDELELTEDQVKSLVRAAAFLISEINRRLEEEGWTLE